MIGSAVASRSSVLVLLALLGLAPGRALACSYVENPPFEIDLAEAAVDHEPPGAIPAIEVWFRRGTGAEGLGCFGGGSSSCDDLGEVGLIITPPTDDRTLPGDLGYRVRFLGGNLPGDLDLASVEGAWRSNPGGEGNAVYFPWNDGAEDLQEPIGFVLEVAAVDKAGNEGPALRVEVAHGGNLGGCSVGGVPVPFAALMTLVTIAIVGTVRLVRTRWTTS